MFYHNDHFIPHHNNNSSTGKDLLKMHHTTSYFNHPQESPDPQGTTNRHLNNHMMIVDSATPIFTTEFTILAVPNLLVGGIDSSLIPHDMINEWNP
jgi:hypothetical protein